MPAIKKNNQELIIGNIYDSDILPTQDDCDFKINRDPNKIFAGNVIFIQGHDTFSSAGDLLTVARDNNIGKIIGEYSTFKPSCYGDLLFWELPNTKLRGGVSFKYFERPMAALSYEDSLHPDVYIHQTYIDLINSIDPYWDWIVKNINAVH